MAEFSSLVITEKGQALITKMMISGGDGLGFTKIATSSTAYPASSLATLTSLSGIKQIAGISNIEKVSNTQVKLDAAVENSQLTEGYTINTIGLYATDPDDGEILYAVCRALVAGYIPAYNGLSVSGATFELVVGVGAAENVELEVDPAVVATMGDIKRHEEKTPATAGEKGIHGIRWFNGEFSVFNGSTWVAMQKAYKTYGVSIDLTNSDPASAVTYTDSAVGMVAGSSDWDNTNIFRDIRPCMFKDGAVKGYLNPNDFSKYVDGTAADITSGAEGDVMIEIPKLGVKIATSDNILTVQVTDDPNAEGFQYLAHTREKSGDKDKLYIGAFLGYNLSSKLRSLCSKQPTANITIGQTRTLAQANGSGYDQIAFYQLTLLQCLFLIKYKNRDSQTALGRGYVTNNSRAIQTGGTVTKGMDFGETTGKQQMKFLGIEDFWGNLYYWIDGLVSSSNYHALTATKNFNDDGTGYTDQGQIANDYVDGYMKTPQGTNELGFIVKTANGSQTTYFADYANFDGGCVPYFGGAWYDGLYAGAFRLYVNEGASSSGAYYGGRLMYL